MAFDQPQPSSLAQGAPVVGARGEVRTVIGGFGARADAQLEGQVSQNMFAEVRDTQWGRLPALQLSTHGYAAFVAPNGRRRVTGIANTGEQRERLAVAYGHELVIYEDPADPTKVAALDAGQSHTTATYQPPLGAVKVGTDYLYVANDGTVKQRVSGTVSTLMSRAALGYRTPVGIAYAATGYASLRIWISFAEDYLINAYELTGPANDTYTLTAVPADDVNADAVEIAIRHPESLYAFGTSLFVVDAETAAVHELVYDVNADAGERWSGRTDRCLDIGVRWGDADPTERPIVIAGVYVDATDAYIIDRTNRMLRRLHRQTGHQRSATAIAHLRGDSTLQSPAVVAPCGLVGGESAPVIWCDGSQYPDDDARAFSAGGVQSFKTADPTPATWPVGETPIVPLQDGQWIAWTTGGITHYVNLDTNEIWWNIAGRTDQLVAYQQSRFIAVDRAVGRIKTSPAGLIEPSIYAYRGLDASATKNIERLPRNVADRSIRWRMQVWFTAGAAYALEHDGTELGITDDDDEPRIIPSFARTERGLYRYDQSDYDLQPGDEYEDIDAPVPTVLSIAGAVIMGLAVRDDYAIVLTQANAADQSVSTLRIYDRVPQSNAELAAPASTVDVALPPDNRIVSSMSAYDAGAVPLVSIAASRAYASPGLARASAARHDIPWRDTWINIRAGDVSRPSAGMAVHRNGSIVVVDTVSDGALIVHDPRTGTQTTIAGSNINAAIGVAIGPTGNIFLLRRVAFGTGNACCVDEYSLTAFVQTMTIPTADPVYIPFSIAVNEEGTIAVGIRRDYGGDLRHSLLLLKDGASEWVETSRKPELDSTAHPSPQIIGIASITESKWATLQQTALFIYGEEDDEWTQVALPDSPRRAIGTAANYAGIAASPAGDICVCENVATADDNGGIVLLDGETLRGQYLYNGIVVPTGTTIFPERFNYCAFLPDGQCLVLDATKYQVGRTALPIDSLLPELHTFRTDTGARDDSRSFEPRTFPAWKVLPRPVPAAVIDGTLHVTIPEDDGDKLHAYRYDADADAVQKWTRAEQSGLDVTQAPTMIRSVSYDCSHIYTGASQPVQVSKADLQNYPHDSYIAFWRINPDTRRTQWSPLASTGTPARAIAGLRSFFHAPTAQSTPIYQEGDPAQAWPFARTDTAEVGIAAPNSILEVSGRLIFVGRTEFGGLGIYQFGGEGDTTPERISNKAVDAVLEAIAEIRQFPDYAVESPLEGGVAYADATEGHVVYCLTFRWPGVTLCFDLDTGLWHTRTSVRNDSDKAAESVARAAAQGADNASLLVTYGIPGQDDDQGASRVRHAAQWRGRLMCGGYNAGGTGVLAWADPRDWHDIDNGTMQRVKTFQIPITGARRGFFGSLRCDLAAGAIEAGVRGWQGSPVVHLEESDDGGRNYRAKDSRTLGPLESAAPIRPFYRLGSSFNRIYRLRCSNAPLVILGAYIDKKPSSKG